MEGKYDEKRVYGIYIEQLRHERGKTVGGFPGVFRVQTFVEQKVVCDYHARRGG